MALCQFLERARERHRCESDVWARAVGYVPNFANGFAVDGGDVGTHLFFLGGRVRFDSVEVRSSSAIAPCLGEEGHDAVDVVGLRDVYALGDVPNFPVEVRGRSSNSFHCFF